MQEAADTLQTRLPSWWSMGASELNQLETCPRLYTLKCPFLKAEEKGRSPTRLHPSSQCTLGNQRECGGESPPSKALQSLMPALKQQDTLGNRKNPVPQTHSNTVPRLPATHGPHSRVLHHLSAPDRTSRACCSQLAQDHYNSSVLLCTAEPVTVRSRAKQELEGSLMGCKLVKAVSPMQLVKPAG